MCRFALQAVPQTDQTTGAWAIAPLSEVCLPPLPLLNAPNPNRITLTWPSCQCRSSHRQSTQPQP